MYDGLGEKSESNKKINIGIIGMGKMGIAHMGILNTLDGVKVRGVADNQGLTLNVLKKLVDSSVGLYKDYKEMISKEDLDLVYITAPTGLHTRIAKDCVDNKINFFVEKPLGLSVSDCSELLDAVKRTPVINMVGYMKRFNDTFKKGKEIIESGILGELIYLNAYMYVSQLFSKGKGWRYKTKSSGGGVLVTFASHLVDTLLWFFGDISLVNGNIKSYYSEDVEDFVHSYLVFKSGLEGYLDTSWSLRNYRLPEVRIEVHGKNGMLTVNDDYVKVYLDKEATWTSHYKQDLFQGVDFDLAGPEYTVEDKYLVECVRSSRKAESDVFSGFKVQEVIDAIYKSAAEKRSVAIT